MSDLPSLILAILYGSSAARPVRISEIVDNLREKYLEVASQRRVKAAIAELRDRGVAIASSRRQPYGYWFAAPGELDGMVAEYAAQIWTSMKRLRAMLGSERRAEEAVRQYALRFGGAE